MSEMIEKRKRLMKNSIFFITLLTMFLVTISFTQDDESLIFSITGDGPYEEGDWDLIPKYIEMERADGRSEFLIHVGDLNSGSVNPDEEYYIKVANLYKTSPIPMIFILGDNEWNDHSDPDFGLTVWNRHFKFFPNNFAHSLNIQRQSEREENVAWVSKHVLFVGLNIVGGRIVDGEEWKTRHQHDFDWMKEKLRQYKNDVHCVVVFAHANPNQKHEDFFSQFYKEVEAFEKPVMYIHGDGHRWIHEPEWKVKNLLRVQVDQISRAPFLQVTVTKDETNPFQFNRRIE